MNKGKSLKLIIVFILIWMFLYYENNFIIITDITIKSHKLPDAFDGYKIVHLSDLHGKKFGKGQKNLVKKIKDARPDLIVFTGDMVDSGHYDAEPVLELVEQISRIAPIYFVTGNHEWWSGKFDVLGKLLEENGIRVLRNAYDRLSKGKDGIYIMGIDDPAADQAGQEEANIIENEIKQVLNGIGETGTFSILLAHRPEMFPLYSEHGFDLILCGHAHGGQVRLPFVGGLVAPNQGFFPKYTSGVYKSRNSLMVVSRGLGNSVIPQRLFNHPEIVVLTLVKD